MKLYTLEFNCNTPTTQQVNIPTNTDYMVGIKVTKNGEVLDIAPAEMTLGGTEADATKTNGYVTFTMASGDDAKYDTKVVAIEMEDGFKTTFTLNINVYKSQQGDIGGAGGGGVTEEWVEDYVSAQTSSLVTGAGYGQAPAILSATSVYASDWATLSSTADENTMYVVLPDPVLLTRVKYTAASGRPDWEGDIVGQITGGDAIPTSQIPNVADAAEIVIGSNVTGLGDYAFFDIQGLSSMTIGNGVTSIGYGTFQNCSGLTSITIGDSVTSIADTAFDSCTSLSSVTIPDSVLSVGAGAFFYCEGLTSVTIPNSVTYIGGGAFHGATSVTDVYCYPNPANLTWYGDDDFKEDGSTVCHVKAEYLAAYQSKFTGEITVTFVGDLA